MNIETQNKICDICKNYGSIEGTHHKQWVINEMLKTILGDDGYTKFVNNYNENCFDGKEQIFDFWDKGIAP